MQNPETPCDTRAETPARETAADSPLTGDRLNVAEWMAMQFGALAVRLVEMWNPPTGPFFASDGRLIADAALFLPADDETPAL